MQLPPTSIVNELAKARNRAAAERTLMSWMQTCVALIGFGIAFDRIFNAIDQVFPGNALPLNLRLTAVIGLGAIGCGVVLLLLAIVTYLHQVRALTYPAYLYRPLSLVSIALIIVAMAIFGTIALLVIFLRLG